MIGPLSVYYIVAMSVCLFPNTFELINGHSWNSYERRYSKSHFMYLIFNLMFVLLWLQYGP
jgi:hypothetical protein